MEIFMGGRLCLLGEHSDWASNYQEVNDRIINGCALAIGLSQGITATVNKVQDEFVIEMPNNFNRSEEHTSELQIYQKKLKTIVFFPMHVVQRC